MGISKIYCLLLSMLLISAALSGCNRSASTSGDAAHEMKSADTAEANAEITSALAELSEEDRMAAEAQKFCAVEQENLLGSMGTPFKVMIEDQPVFLCCEGCKDRALQDPQATLAAVAHLKRSHSSPK